MGMNAFPAGELFRFALQVRKPDACGGCLPLNAVGAGFRPWRWVLHRRTPDLVDHTARFTGWNVGRTRSDTGLRENEVLESTIDRASNDTGRNTLEMTAPQPMWSRPRREPRVTLHIGDAARGRTRAPRQVYRQPLFPLPGCPSSPFPAARRRVLDRPQCVRALACRLHAATQEPLTASHAALASDEPGGEPLPSHHTGRDGTTSRTATADLRDPPFFAPALLVAGSFRRDIQPCVTRERGRAHGVAFSLSPQWLETGEPRKPSYRLCPWSGLTERDPR